MKKNSGWLCLLDLLATALLVSAAFAAGKAVDLLDRPETELTYCSDVHTTLASLQALNHGNSSNAYTLPAGKNSVWEVVYKFNGEVCTPERLEIRLANEATAAPRLEPCGTVQVLASDLQDRVGFQEVWALALYATKAPQAVDLPPRAARWLMLRFAPTTDSGQLRLAQVHVFGSPGRPHSNYQFKENPAQALDVLEKIKTTANEGEISAAEHALFADAHDGKFRSLTLAEAALIAAGVHDAGARGEYLQKLQKLAAIVRQEIPEDTPPKIRAERLLARMHGLACQGGYDPTQSSLAVLLDRHTFNCVSATILFNFLARDLHLDARAVEVPTHVFSILYWGTNGVCDVETTTPGGVDPLSQPELIRRLEAEQKLVYISKLNPEMRREVGDSGLVALVYYNRGVLLSQENKFAPALTAGFCCLSLDPEFSQAVQNVLVALNNWSLNLIETRNYPKAVRVITAGISLVPQDVGFQDTRRLIYMRWAEETLEQGQTNKALDILKAAARADPGGDFERRQALVVIQPADRLTKKKQWVQALALAAAGSSQLSAAGRAELASWRKATYLAWMRAGLEGQDYAEAAQAMEAAESESPGNQEYLKNLAYAVQAGAMALYKKSGRQAAEAWLRGYHNRFPGELMSQAAAGYVGMVLESLRAGTEYAPKALAVVSECEPLLPSSPEISGLLLGLYEQAAWELVQGKQYAAALDVYQQGRGRFPQNEHLRTNEIAVWNLRAQAFMQASQWDLAEGVYVQALRRFPQENIFLNNLKYCQMKNVK